MYAYNAKSFLITFQFRELLINQLMQSTIQWKSVVQVPKFETDTLHKAAACEFIADQRPEDKCHAKQGLEREYIAQAVSEALLGFSHNPRHLFPELLSVIPPFLGGIQVGCALIIR